MTTPAYQTVWKFPITAVVQTIPMPRGARIIGVHTQDNNPTMWALIPADVREHDERTFRVVGTGHDVPPHHEYVGTCHGIDGGLVFHVFEKQQNAHSSPEPDRG